MISDPINKMRQQPHNHQMAQESDFASSAIHFLFPKPEMVQRNVVRRLSTLIYQINPSSQHQSTTSTSRSASTNHNNKSYRNAMHSSQQQKSSPILIHKDNESRLRHLNASRRNNSHQLSHYRGTNQEFVESIAQRYFLHHGHNSGRVFVNKRESMW